ncbi:kinase [Candidatus Nitromaritima sp. SCGC AAA799-A02]|nr:kinase [Candidatus Nitromaritima sp. SCGC AAA799-A02]
MIISQTPFRISFFGGGTDYPAWYKEHGGRVLAAAIDKYCYISCRYLPPFFEHKYRIVYGKSELVNSYHEIEHPSVRAVLGHLECDQGLEIHHFGDLPARAGLGSSSAFTVGLLNALYAMRGIYRSADHLAKEAIFVEQELLKEHVGIQDQITTAHGGFNFIEFHSNGSFEVSPCVLPPNRFNFLQNHLMLFFTGLSRFASEIAKSKIQNITNKAKEFQRIGEMVNEGGNILQSKNTSLNEFGKLLDEAWNYKRKLSDKVSSSHLDNIYETALKAGALGGKILGAGGGGFLLLFVPTDRQDQVRKKLSSLTEVPFRFNPTGSRIVLFHPNGFG